MILKIHRALRILRVKLNDSCQDSCGLGHSTNYAVGMQSRGPMKVFGAKWLKLHLIDLTLWATIILWSSNQISTHAGHVV